MPHLLERRLRRSVPRALRGPPAPPEPLLTQQHKIQRPSMRGSRCIAVPTVQPWRSTTSCGFSRIPAQRE